MNRVNLIKHNIPHYSNKVLKLINNEIRFKTPMFNRIIPSIQNTWIDPFDFGWKLMRAMNYNTIYEWSLKNRNSYVN